MHPVFRYFPRQEVRAPAQFAVNFLGVRTRRSFYGISAPPAKPRGRRCPLPAVNEEYFEWIDVLESVLCAQDRFTMIELGAGYGRWLAHAVGACRVQRQKFRLIGVEAEPSHFQFLKQNMRDNGVWWWQRRLIQAAAAGKPGEVWFHVGRPEEWYGQAIDRNLPAPEPEQRPWYARKRPRAMSDHLGERQAVKTVTLDELLSREALVDLIDLDVQGAELEVLAASRQLDAKVRRVHIGTHAPELEDGLRELFGRLGWQKLHDYPCLTERVPTPYGLVSFQDGVQGWLNPKLARLPEYSITPARRAA